MIEKILVVDDDPSALHLMTLTLQAEGYQVSTATNGLEALALAAGLQPDLIILDIMMPDMDGYEVCRRLRDAALTSHIPVIMLTAKTQIRDKLEGFQVGADDYVLKPVDPSEVVARVRAILSRVRRPKARDGEVKRSPAGVMKVRTGLAKLIVFFSPKGGVGTTSMCVNTAASLAGLHTGGVVLVDLVLPMGSVGAMVGLDRCDTIAKLARGSEEEFASRELSDYLFTRPGLGFHVLLAPADPREAHLVSSEHIEPLFDKLLLMTDYVVVDVGRALSRITLPVIRRADHLVVVLASDQATLNLAKSALQYFESLGIASKRLVPILNRAVGRQGLSKEQTERYLGVPIALTVPYEEDRFTVAINQGMPLVQREPNCAAALSLRDLALQLQ